MPKSRHKGFDPAERDGMVKSASKERIRRNPQEFGGKFVLTLCKAPETGVFA